MMAKKPEYSRLSTLRKEKDKLGERHCPSRGMKGGVVLAHSQNCGPNFCSRNPSSLIMMRSCVSQNARMTISVTTQSARMSDNPIHTRKFPRYSGCRTIEYIPLEFKVSACCAFVLRTDVPWGTHPIVTARTINPANAMPRQTKSQTRLCERAERRGCAT